MTIDPDVDSVLTRIAAHQGRPISALIREVLQEAQPAFQATADALDLVKTNPQRAVREMIGLFDQATAEAHQAVFPLRRKRGRKPKG